MPNTTLPSKNKTHTSTDICKYPLSKHYQHLTWKNAKPCCEHTMKEHCEFNTLMVCDQCHQWIKIFEDLQSLERFVIFSEGLSRSIEACKYNGYYVVIYSSFKKTPNPHNH